MSQPDWWKYLSDGHCPTGDFFANSFIERLCLLMRKIDLTLFVFDTNISKISIKHFSNPLEQKIKQWDI